MPAYDISQNDLRRLIALRQGLLPGHFGAGFADVGQAVRSLGSLQMDPLTIVARSHDLVLHARVDGYRPSMLTDELCGERSLFEYGGVLAAHPRESLPFWRRHMKARREDPRYRDAMTALGDDGRRLIRALASHGPQTARQVAARFDDGSTRRTTSSGSYRSQRTTDKGLYQLWLGGRIVTHHRTDSFERVYDLPGAQVAIASPRATTDFFLEQALWKQTVSSVSDLRSSLAGGLHQRVAMDDCVSAISRLERSGKICRIKVEGKRQQYHMLSDLIPQLQIVSSTSEIADRTGWNVTLLSPLDPVVGASRRLFDYDYTWEIYKPEARRRYGPFAMPILYGHQLVGRADLRADRDGDVLVVNGIWLEDTSLVGDDRFTRQLRDTLRRLAVFAGVTSLQIVRGEPEAWVEASRPILCG